MNDDRCEKYAHFCKKNAFLVSNLVIYGRSVATGERNVRDETRVCSRISLSEKKCVKI